MRDPIFILIVTFCLDCQSDKVAVYPNTREHPSLRPELEDIVQLLPFSVEYKPNTQTVLIQAFGIRVVDDKHVPRFAKTVERVAHWFSKSSEIWQAEQITFLPRTSLKNVDRYNYFIVANQLKERFLGPVTKVSDKSG